MMLAVMPELAAFHNLPLTRTDDGTIRLAGSRVTLDSVLTHFNLGASLETIADRFPTVPLSSIYAAIYYYLDNREAVEEYLRQQDANATRIRQTIEASQDRVAIRERWLRCADKVGVHLMPSNKRATCSGAGSCVCSSAGSCDTTR